MENRQIAIIGGGVIGGGWLARFLLNGWDVNLYDPDPEAMRKISEVLENARHALPMLYEQNLAEEGRLRHCEHIKDAVCDAVYIQESVPERLELKQKVMAEIQAHCLPSAVIASSTSGFKPSELQASSQNPEQIMVCHPFNPVYLLPLVEMVPGPQTAQHHITSAQQILEQTGMYPLVVRKEIDAHIADRLLEAVWREGLWLVHDQIATTQEIDDAIRYGFGLRWAQMGLFETYRIAGGEAGMAHFISQFGPALKWPWTKLMDVPELDEALIQQIADQSDAQSGHLSIRELERLRDHNLVAMMRALKQQDSAAGNIIKSHEKLLKAASDPARKKHTIARTIPIDWTDYNGHMNESRYGQLFSDAADEMMASLGADEAYIKSGYSYFTVETTIRYLAETHAGEAITVDTDIILAEGKKLKLQHVMRRASDAEQLATAEQFLLHVSLDTRRSCPPVGDVAAAIENFQASSTE